MNSQDSQGNMSDDMKARLNELKQKEESGDLDDMGREELANMRDDMGM